jgi:hypothetical protein
VAGFKSEWWPDLFRNGGRLQIGTPAGFSSEHPAGLNRNPHPEAWATLHSDTSRPFDKPTKGRIAVKVINHLGDEVMKVFRV